MFQAPWYSKPHLNYDGLNEQQKWLAQKLHQIHNKDIDFTNSVRIPTQYETFELKSAISGQPLQYPIRSLDCIKNHYCIMNQKDVAAMLLEIYHKQPNKQNILKYECVVCKSKSYTSEGKNKKISNLYFDKQMQFYIQLAKQKFDQFVNKSKEQQKKKGIVRKRFKNSSLRIYKNGRVQLLYRDTFNQKTDQKHYQLLGPTYSKVQTEIYFNPFDEYKFYIKNRDILKIVDRFMEKGIIEYMKESVNKAQSLGVEDQTIQKYVNMMRKSICDAYENNITFNTTKQTPKPLVMLVKSEQRQAKYLVLRVFYPYERAWNDYQIKTEQKQANMIRIIQRNTQIYVTEKNIFLISPNQSFKIKLDAKKQDRYQAKQFQAQKSISHDGKVIHSENATTHILLPKQGITSTLLAKKLIQPNFKLQLQGIQHYDKSLFYFGGRKVSIIMDRDGYPNYEYNSQSFSNQIHYFDRTNKKWVTITDRLPSGVHSPTIVKRDHIAYIIGGVKQQKHQTVYSQDIVIFDLKKKKIIEKKLIEGKHHYKSMYFVTQSMTPEQYILFSFKQGRYQRSRFTKALIFDSKSANIVGQFEIANKWAKRTDEDHWKTLIHTFSYPSVSTNYQGINFMITTDIFNEDIHQLFYGSDSCWLKSAINEKLI